MAANPLAGLDWVVSNLERVMALEKTVATLRGALLRIAALPESSLSEAPRIAKDAVKDAA